MAICGMSVYCCLQVKHTLLPQRVCNLFMPSLSPYDLRKAGFLLPRFTSVTFGKHSLRYTGPKLWNNLPTEARNISPLKQFKAFIRKTDLTKILDTNLCKNCTLCSTKLSLSSTYTAKIAI